MNRPASSEYPEHFERYVSLVSGDDLLRLLENQERTVRDALRAISDQQAGARYAPGKWSVREVLGHIVDTERIFGCRALCIARGEAQSLPGFDENAYAAAAGHDAFPLAELAEEFVDLRRSHILMFRHLDPTAWHQSGLVNNKPMSVRAMAFIMAGHVRHHTLILAERYGIRITSWPTPASPVNIEDS
jgi:hypothetical protein